jgi:hypothetical protein
VLVVFEYLCAHVRLDSAAERIGAEILFGHAQKGLTLVVRDRGIEGGFRFEFVRNLLEDRMRGELSIGVHRVLFGGVLALPPSPGRIRKVGLTRRHP